MRTLLTLLARRPHFRRLWMSDVVSLMGDWMSFVAVSLLALQQGGGALSLALVLAAHSLPHALLAPVAGTLADRLDRKRLLVGVNVIEGMLTLGMAAAAVFGHVVAVQILVFVRASVGAFLAPVQSAAMRRVVHEDELLTANTLSSATWSAMFALGMAAGGALATLGPVVALLADAASFGLAALLLRGLPSMPVVDAANASPKDALLAVSRDMAAAWRVAWSKPTLLEAVLAKTPVALAAGGAWVLINLISDHVAFAGSAALTLGILQCVRGIGTGVGPVIAEALIRRGLPIEVASCWSTWTTFGGIALFGLTQQWWALMVTVFIWGMGGGSNWVLSSTDIQRLSSDRFIGRLSAIDGLAWTLGTCVAALLSALVVDQTGMRATAAWLGLALGISAWLGLRWMKAVSSVQTNASMRLGVSQGQ